MAFTHWRDGVLGRAWDISDISKTRHRKRGEYIELQSIGDDTALDVVHEALHAVATTELPEITERSEISDLGYDSVQILEALTHIEETTGARLSQQELIGVRTVGDLAEAVRASLANVESGQPQDESEAHGRRTTR